MEVDIYSLIFMIVMILMVALLVFYMVSCFKGAMDLAVISLFAIIYYLAVQSCGYFDEDEDEDEN